MHEPVKRFAVSAVTVRLRDRARPEFRIYNGNDLAIDMVFYGSDGAAGGSGGGPALIGRG